MQHSYLTLIIIAITGLTSYAAFQNNNLLNKLLFYPAEMKQSKEYWRFITHGLVHADFQHLVFNLLTLYFFGRNLETAFDYIFGTPIAFPIFYIAALVASSIPSYFKHKDDYYYRSLGASGAISAVLFATILFDPWQTLLLHFIIPIPAIIFAIGYLAYSTYMSKNAQDNVGHDAHLWGAIFGFVCPLAMKPQLLPYFISQLSHPHFF